MTRVSYSARCIFCGHNNHRRSKHAIFFHCGKCGEVNPGPGMSKAHAQALTVALQPAVSNGRKRTEPVAAVIALSPPAAAATVIKAAKTQAVTSPPKPAPKSSPAPVAPVKPEEKPKRSWVYG